MLKKTNYFAGIIGIFILMGVGLISCEQNSVTEPQKDPVIESNSILSPQGGVSEDSLTISFLNLGTYLDEQDELHEGALFDYMKNTPGYSLQDLVNLGYVNLATVQTEVDIIINELTSKSEQEVLDVIDYLESTSIFSVTHETGTDFSTMRIVSPNPRNRDGFVIFRARGLLSEFWCLKFLWWYWGNSGC